MTFDTFDMSFIKYNPKLGEIFGRGESMFIATLQFFLNNQNLGVEKKGKKWVYNTFEQWAQYTKYSSRQIERIVSKLSKQGIIIVQKLNRCKANRTNYYTVDEEKLEAMLQEKNAKDQDTGTSTSHTKTELNIKNRTFTDKMSECFRHEGEFITKKTNKEGSSISEEKESAQIGMDKSEVLKSVNQQEQVKQVKKIKPINNNTKNNSQGDTHNPRTPIAQEMLSIWNKSLEKSPTLMSKQLAPLLVAAYKYKFNSDVKDWEKYCQMIASSSYLTGESFNLSLLWVLKYTIIDRIKNLDFGVKKIETQNYSQEDAITHIQTLNETQKCKDIRLKLLALYGEKVYKNWFSRIRLQVIENKVCFQAENKFMHDYIASHYGQIFGSC